MTQYVAFLHPNSHDGYSIEFPDFGPGIAAASQLETACVLAEASLQAMIADLLALGCSIPEPRELTEASRHQHDPQAIAILVDAYLPDPQKYARPTCPELLN